ncbi:MAG: four helix bundle protein [Bacteroidota bacterium]
MKHIILGRENVIQTKSFDFALNIVRLVKKLQNEQKEYVLSKQVLRSGTAIGAMIREAEHAESKKDFTHKMSISLKEANETRYWLDLLYKSDFMEAGNYQMLNDEITQILRILASIVKSSKLKS